MKTQWLSEAVRYGLLGSFFRLMQPPKPALQGQFPISYHECNNMPEPNIVDLKYNDSNENIEEDLMQILCNIEDNIWNSSPLRNPKLKAKIH